MLTEHQSQIFSAMLADPSPIVNFNGPAGTGKTYTINDLLNTTDASIELTATTNKALSHYDVDGRTTASFLGFTMVYGSLREKQNHIQSRCHYLVVDESSMLSRQLLRAIEEYVKQGYFHKVILVGDPIQLQIDQFLDLSQYPSYELQQPMRQTEDNALKNELIKLRAKIEKKGSPERLNDDNVSIIRYDDHKLFLQAYKNSQKHKYLLAYKNQTVRTYNRKVVKDLHKRPNEYNVGDVLIALSPLFDNKGKMLLKNREEFLIDDIVEFDNYWQVNSVVKIPKTKTWLEQQLQVFKDSKDWKNFYKIKESFIFVHHSYAGTVHSAQGATFDEVFIDVTDFAVPNDPISQTLLRLMYVGLSRARQTAHIFVGESRTWTGLE